ncbi:alpha/beta fold hydrolase [Pseudonocardia acaciae]|uniref:alpha/beta fold hydrolase n=1 Tax=Pseudonocardia acaciae TaxID=551276 RepID=UPI000491F663|nr:alpha/beta fold hydrolase [Pseudonocardia acaciae]
MSWVVIEGTVIEYDDTCTDVGAGDPLVLIHGHPFNRSMWRPQVEHFARAGRRVVTPDLRGYGRSAVVPAVTGLETFARDIAGLLDHLGLRRVMLGGLSMGGQVVLEFYRLFPDRVRALVLADTSAPAESPSGRRERSEMAARLLREGLRGYADEVLPKMVAPSTLRTRPEVADHVLDMMRGTSPLGAAAALRGRSARPSYVELLPHIRVPTLVVVGGEDEFTPISDAELIADRVPDATLEIVHGAGHLPNLERPAEFNAALEHFLRSLPSDQDGFHAA